MSKTRDLGDFTSAGNPLADGTIDVADINGVTASVTEINKLTGLTASTAELNILDGLTATTSELNNVTGVNSDVQTQLDAKVDLAGDTMTGFLTLHADPTSALHAATKEYVDTIAAAGIHYHTAVRVEAPSNLNATYDNGTSGVGATLTNAGTNAAITIDGVALSLNDRVLVYNQTNAAHNGVYTVTTVGDGSTAWVLTRATDADSYGASDSDALGEGDAFFVKEGDTGAGELYVMTTSGTITFGTTNITFTVIAETAVYSAGTGMSLDGTTFSIGQAVGTSDSPTFAGITSTSGASVTGTVTATAFSGDGSALTGIEGVPSGIIAMWSGSTASIPSGWVICDGLNSTPDLRDRFIVGAGNTYAVAATGGSNTVTLTESEMPGHTHTISGNTSTTGAHTHTLSGNTGNSGNHTHNGSTSNTGDHNHNLIMWNYQDGSNTVSGTQRTGQQGSANGGNFYGAGNAGSHSHNFTTAAGGDHSHTLSGNAASAGDHSHTLSATAASTGGGSAHENRPPYYALAYIMKT